MKTTAYVYKWTHIPTLKWYVGVRTRKGCHPGDGYLTSSKHVKSSIKSHPNEWQQTVIATGNPDEMRDLESEILNLFDAKRDSRSFNLHNCDGKFVRKAGILVNWSEESRKAASQRQKNRKASPETIAKMKSIKRTQAFKDNLSKLNKGRKGKPFTEEQKKAQSARIKAFYDKLTPEQVKAKCDQWSGKIKGPNPRMSCIRCKFELSNSHFTRHWLGIRCNDRYEKGSKELESQASCLECKKILSGRIITQHYGSNRCIERKIKASNDIQTSK